MPALGPPPLLSPARSAPAGTAAPELALQGEMTRRAALHAEAEKATRALAVADAVSVVVLRAGSAASLAGLPFAMARAR